MTETRWRRTRISILLAVGILGFGCGSTNSREGQAGTGWPGPITIPVKPRSHGVIGSFTDVNTPPLGAWVDLAQVPSKIVWAKPLQLAVGPDYPSAYTATVDNLLWSTCGGASEGYFEGTVALHEVTGNTGAVVGMVSNDARVILSVTGEADVTLVVTGEVDVTSPGGCASAGIHPFEVQLAVSAFRPRGTTFVVPPSCAQASVKRVAPGGRMSDRDGYLSSGAPPMFRPLPINATGVVIEVANADPLAQVAIDIDGPLSGKTSGMPVAVPTSIDALVFPDVAGPVTLNPPVGDPLVVEVVDPRQVSAIDIAIELAGFVGAPLELMDMENYGLDHWHRRQNRIEARVKATYVGTDALCSVPAYSWFTLESTTTAICETMAVELPDVGCYQFSGNSIGQGARFIGDGTCSLSLLAPELLSGAGYSQALTFQVSDVIQLYDSVTDQCK